MARNMDLFEKIGIDGSYLVIGALAGMLLLFILYIVLLSQHNKLKKKYNKFMEGADGSSLEQSILQRFQEIDAIKQDNETNNKDINHIKERLSFAYQKMAVIKYDAFQEMGGKLSFSLCMLDETNNGFIITSMHSTREGCYTYVKEIIKGESFVLLSEEEKEALDEAKNKSI